jgi:hypothetical protein
MSASVEKTTQPHDGSGPEDWRYGIKSMAWFGWGSPIGLGSFLVSIGVFLVLLHYARLIG